MGIQKIFEGKRKFEAFDRYLTERGVHHIFLVCGRSYEGLQIKQHLDRLQEQGLEVTRFSAFQPNPSYKSVETGVEKFRASHANLIFAVGGGSAMDVAKCIKLYSTMDPGKNYLEQAVVPNMMPLAVLPTTAGTGSEATRYAVVYYRGEKKSVTDASIVPEAVIFDPAAVLGLSAFQKKATMLDALCHAIESFWSVNSTEASQKLSMEAVRLIRAHVDGYLGARLADVAAMQRAAFLAGRAINITQTTAGHAMCYKLTSCYGLPHGQAAALCVAALWPYMLEHMQDTIDVRGATHLSKMFARLAEAMGCANARSAADAFQAFVHGLGMDFPQGKAVEEDIFTLAASVNPVRLKNHPIRLTESAMAGLYRTILHLT